MGNFSLEILGLTSEAAMLVQHGKIKYLNAAARRLLGNDPCGKPLSSVFGPDVAGSQAGSLVADVSVKGRRFMLRLASVDNDRIVFFSPSALPELGISDSFICAMRNNLMSAELSSGFLSERARELGDKILTDSLNSLNRSQYRAARIINNASFIMNSGSGLNAHFSAGLNISALCSDATGKLAEIFPAQRFYTELEENIIMPADPALILQLLLNLISNCLMHAVNMSVIKICLEDKGDYILLTVSDDGEGLEVSELHGIFKPGCCDRGLSDMARGAGLGLSVVRRIAALHNGSFLMESRPGFGTRVWVSLGKTPGSDAALHSGRHPALDKKGMLIGLADCLPADLYSESLL